VTLTKGANTVKFTASQLYNYDGTTIGLVHSGGGTDVGKPGASAPRSPTASDYQLVAVNSGKCVNVSDISTAVGALVHQWTCDTGSTLATKRNQIWRLTGKD
jgi:hypothetical protein